MTRRALSRIAHCPCHREKRLARTLLLLARELLHEQVPQARVHRLRRRWRHGPVEERVYGRKDGTRLTCSNVTTRLGDDAALGFITVARDLTAQRDAADALARATAGVEAHVAQRTEVLQREEERARMARDLHEQLGAQVSALRVVLEQLRDRSTAQQPADETLTQALQLTHALSSKVDFLASGLRRPAR